MGGSPYFASVRDIMDQELSRQERILELADLCEKVAENSYDQGKSDAETAEDNRLQDDLVAAENEWREIVESFKRSDLTDVRSRLMDLGNILQDFNLWIPSR